MSNWVLLLFWAVLLHLALIGRISLPGLVAALVLGTALLALLRPPRRRARPVQIPTAIVLSVWYVLVLLWDIWRSGVIVAKMVLHPKLPIHPGVVAIPSYSKRRWVTAASAHSITVTPGEMVMEIGDDGTLYVHCLDSIASGQSADGAQKSRAAKLQRMML